MRLPTLGSFLAVRLLALATLLIFATQLVVIAVLWRAPAGSAGFRLPLPGRAAAIVESVDAATPDQLQSLLRALNSGDLHIRIEPELMQADTAGGLKVGAFRRAMTRYTNVLEGRHVVGMVGSGRRKFEEPVLTPEGVEARYPMRLVVELADGQLPDEAGVAGAVMASAALWSIWQALRPVRDMAQSARTFSATGAPQFVKPGGGAELRNLISEFNTLQTRVARLLASRTLVMSAMSHDVRTYLTRLRLRIEGLEPESRAAAEKTIEEIRCLLDDSLAFAEADGADFALSPVRLSEVLAKIAQSGQFREGDLDVSGMADCHVQAEPSRLERALVNIITNAVKYGGKAHIVLRQRGAEALIEISDKGPGIPAAFRAKVFEPFFRMEGSRNRSLEGAGLGLAIARRLIERHGGTVTLGEAPSGGLKVLVSLPCA